VQKGYKNIFTWFKTSRRTFKINNAIKIIDEEKKKINLSPLQ